MPVRGEGEGFAAAPAEAGDEELAVGGGQLLAVVGGGVEVGGDLVAGEAGDGLGHGSCPARESVPPPWGPRRSADRAR